MKKYEIPQLKITAFEKENVVTSSGVGSTDNFSEAQSIAGQNGRSVFSFNIDDVTITP